MGSPSHLPRPSCFSRLFVFEQAHNETSATKIPRLIGAVITSVRARHTACRVLTAIVV